MVEKGILFDMIRSMLEQPKWAFRTLLVLGALLVGVSNHIVILNEEILIALSFFGFLAFTRKYFGTTLRNALEDRRKSIESEVQDVLDKREGYLTELLESEKKRTQRKNQVRKLIQYTTREIQTFARLSETQYLPRVFNENLRKLLLALAMNAKKFEAEYQSLVVDTFRSNLIYSLQGQSKAFQKTEAMRLGKSDF